MDEQVDSILTCFAYYRWLYGRGRESDGDEALKKFMDCDEMDERFMAEKTTIKEAIDLEHEQTKPWSLTTLFTGDGSPTNNVQRIWYAFARREAFQRTSADTVQHRASIIVNTCGPFFGTSLITFYGGAILEGVGITGDTVVLCLAAINTGVPNGMALSMFVLPRVGRRPILCWCGTVRQVFVCMANTGLLTWFLGAHDLDVHFHRSGKHQEPI